MSDDPKKPKPPLLYGPDDRPLPETRPFTGAAKVSKHTTRKRSEKPAKKAKGLAKALRLLKALAALISVATTFVTLCAIFPRVTVEPLDFLFDEQNALSVPLNVQNNGLLAIHDGVIKCTIDSLIDSTSHTFIHNSVAEQAVNLPIGDLAGGGYATTSCPTSGTPLGLSPPSDKLTGHVTLDFSFRPSFWPRHIHRFFYLGGFSTPDRRMRWIPTSN